MRRGFSAIALIAGASTIALSAGACKSPNTSGSGDGKLKQLTVLIPSAPGGNLDTNVRLLQPALQTALKTTVIVVNNATGNGVGASSDEVQKGGDCSYLLSHNVPAILYNIKQPGVPFKASDFTAAASFLTDIGTIRVLKSSKWKTMGDFLAAARANPGKISISLASNTVSNYQGMLDLEKAAGVKFNLVPFTGGGPARTALIGGQVDATATNAYESLSIAPQTRVLGVQQATNKWTSITDNAPTMSTAVGRTVPDSSTLYGFFLSSACVKKHPQTAKTIEQAIESATKDPTFVGKLDKLGTKGSLQYLDASAFRSQIIPIAKDIGGTPTS